MPKLGRLVYLNSAPLYYGIDQSPEILKQWEIIPGVPATLNRMLAAGEIDVSAISAVEYARHQDEYYMIPDICLNSDGMVKSVLLISKFPIETLNGKKVALSTSSATGQALVRTLLKQDYYVDVEYLEMAPDLELMMRTADACLLIGDDALLMRPHDEWIVYDLGLLWKEFCGYPVVFAVAAIRQDFVHQFPEASAMISAALKSSLQLGLKHIDVFGDYPEYRGIAQRITMKDYFSHLKYSFEQRQIDGLLFYYQQAAQLGLCPECKDIRFL